MSEATQAWLRLALARVGYGIKRRLIQDAASRAMLFLPMDRAREAVIRQALGDGDGQAMIKAYHETEAFVERSLAWAAEAGNHLLFCPLSLIEGEASLPAHPHQQNYPQKLSCLSDPPLVLYAKGDLGWLSSPSLAVVGSRSASAYGERLAEDFARELANAGLVIVSGLALGVDAFAHRGAMSATAEQKGATIAVLGTGANIIYPYKHKTLAREIAECGLILSEFPLDTHPQAQNFPRRNRIIAGLSLGCLVIEASDQSGALITARLAGEMGKEVFAIPGSVHSPLSRGPHRLLREGAKLVETTRDVLEELHAHLLSYLPNKAKIEKIESANESESPATILISEQESPTMPRDEGAPHPQSKKPPVRKKAPSNRAPSFPDAESAKEHDELLSAIPYSPILLDDIVERTGKSVAQVHAQLLDLEIAGRVESLAGGRFQRIR